MKKKIIFGSTTVLILFLGLIIGIIIWGQQKITYTKYLIIKENLYLDENIFEAVNENISAIVLGEQIGITDSEQQVYAIQGMNSNEWICVRVDGIEYIFKNINIKNLHTAQLTTTHLQIKDQYALGGSQTIIKDIDTLEAIMGYLVDENLANPPEKVNTFKQVNVYVKEYPELYYTLYYLNNETDGCFLFDPITETAWSIGHELMMQMM